MERQYLAIDLKSFYASVECVERCLDPLKTNLVVADASRTEKTICLAVSPSLKAYGIPGRARLFEVVQRVKEVNAERLKNAKGHEFTGKSIMAPELDADKNLELDYIAATPRMGLYMQYSNKIYEIYLKYVSHEDMHIYSVDEVFIDVTSYLNTYKMTAKELAMKMINEVLDKTGITATAGIGTNLYLCKIAMDIVAKHAEPDENGVRIAEINERSYRELLWDHTPITDFWRVGRGISKKLAEYGMFTMGDVARCSIGAPNDFYNEDFLFKLFGVNAELLIDHAWGYEPVTIKDIKSYKPETHSVSHGQVLTEPYENDKARIVIREMVDSLVLELVEKDIVTNQIVITIGYDVDNLLDEKRNKAYKGRVSIDRYGRKVPYHAHGTKNLPKYTSSSNTIIDAALELFDEITDKSLLIRRMTVVAEKILPTKEAKEEKSFEQLSLFDFLDDSDKKKKEDEKLEKERRLQLAVLDVKKRFGKNAMLKGTNLQEGATAKDRNAQIGGHKA
ncbi:MAG: DNA methylase [Lachnospiraceae bacterium]|nr:DNA methylase [Lachnospiraceae bacterium]